MSDQAQNNTDRERWRETPGDYYAPSLHVTQEGGIGMNVGGFVIVKPVRDWHRLAAPAAEPSAPSAVEIIAGLERAHDEAARVTKERWYGTGDWRVSIPARLDYDSDLIICYAIRAAIKYIRTLGEPLSLPTDAQNAVRRDVDRHPHREICALCHEVNRVGFHVPDDVWAAAVHASQLHSIQCLRCFTRLADERGVRWDVGITFYPVSWITHTVALREGGRA